MIEQILSIGVSDSSAGTGIQADIKTSMAFGVYAATVVTAVAMQNTNQVFGIHEIPSDIVKTQLKVVMDDLQPKVIKSGMLANEEIINVIGDFMDEYKTSAIKYLVDPVMTSRSGSSLLDKPARDALKRRLLIYADVLTPNKIEAEELTGMTIRDIDDMKHAAQMLMSLGAKHVIVKGGALASDVIHNVYCDEHTIEVYEQPRYTSRATHGAGTTFTAAMACLMAQGRSVQDSFGIAQNYLTETIRTGKKLGSGFGPVNHGFHLKSYTG
jgi:hydroxymethylpyrimidine/phosphomethylpyrimidine kinase